MEAFHKIKIKCPYEILEIEEIKIKNKPNEHGYTYIKGIVDDSINFKYAIEASTEDKICIYEQNEDNENNKETIIFNGKIQNIITNNNIDGIYHIEIEAYTSSFDLDIEEKSRSFQDIEMSYDDFLNIIMMDFPMYGYMQCMEKPESIGFPRFQYKESSYRMIVRTASYLGINVYCDIINPSNAFYFGKPSGREYELEDDIDYSATLDINKYRESLVHNPDFHPTDFFYYEIKTPKVMQISDKVTFKQKKFYVYSYEAEYVRGELIYTYRLCREKGIWQEKIYNDKLKGISLEGKVLEVSGEQVKLHLDIDETQNQAKAAWFRYAPPTGNIMYSMPIVGTSANLYFPNERNEEPIVIGCVRKNGSSCEKFSDVNNRYFSTESGNNLDMLPDAINFSRPGLSANFNDGSGITLSSSSSLSINAGYVGMFAGNVSIEGKRKLVAERGASIISLENDFYNDAGIVKENGSDRASNEPFDDDPQKGAAEAKAAIEAAAQFDVSAIAGASEGAIGSIGDFSSLTNSVESKSDSSGLGEKSLLESVLDFLFPATPCYAAERSDPALPDSKTDKANANDPLNLYSNKPWMNIDTNIRLPKNECYITHDDGNSIPVDSDPYRVNVGESGDGFWGKVGDFWVSTPIYKGLADMAEWQDKHPQEMELLNIGMIFVGLTAYGTSSPMFLDDECEILEKDAVKVTNKNLSISDEELEKIIKYTNKLDDINSNIYRNNLTKDQIANEICGKTAKSTQIANYIREGKIKVNIISSELYDYAYDDSVAHCEISSGSVNIYVRKDSETLFQDVVHEGTHAVDMYDKIGYDDLQTVQSWELRAYMAEEEYRRSTGEIVKYPSTQSMVNHIQNEYENANEKFDPYIFERN